MHQTADDIQHLFTARGLAAYWPAFQDKLQPCIRLRYSLVEDAAVAVGASKLGGLPDLPPGTAWPTFDGLPLSFLGQLNLAELPDAEVRNLLPQQGMLSFFHSVTNDDYEKSPHAVVLSPVPASELACRPQPADWPDGEEVFKTGALAMAVEQSLPSDMGEYARAVFHDAPPSEWSSYCELAEPDNSRETTNKVFGYAARNLDDDLEVVAEIIYAGRDATGWQAYADQLSVPEKTAIADNWLLLLQLDYNDDLGMGFGDMDQFYFWIRKTDLANRDFTKVVAFTIH
ncbi:MAG: YwqG family protein [Janthinobacterium lividum]